jgi:hypothetical protein
VERPIEVVDRDANAVWHFLETAQAMRFASWVHATTGHLVVVMCGRALLVVLSSRSSAT